MCDRYGYCLSLLLCFSSFLLFDQLLLDNGIPGIYPIRSFCLDAILLENAREGEVLILERASPLILEGKRHDLSILSCGSCA